MIWHRRKSGCQGVAPDVQMLAIDGASSAWPHGFDQPHAPPPLPHKFNCAVSHGLWTTGQGSDKQDHLRP